MREPGIAADAKGHGTYAKAPWVALLMLSRLLNSALFFTMNKRKLKKIEKENQKRKLDSARAEAYKNRVVPVDKSKLNLGNSYDILKRDTEIKLIVGCSDHEIETIKRFYTSEYMSSIILKR